jgi:hypothetical protein
MYAGHAGQWRSHRSQARHKFGHQNGADWPGRTITGGPVFFLKKLIVLFVQSTSSARNAAMSPLTGAQMPAQPVIIPALAIGLTGADSAKRGEGETLPAFRQGEAVSNPRTVSRCTRWLREAVTALFKRPGDCILK